MCVKFTLINSHPGPDVARQSTVPPHLVDQRGNSFRSSLIPFCAFDGNMTSLGHDIDGLGFPACDQFKPDIMDGHLCFTLDIKRMHSEDKARTAHGKGTGLWLLVDPGSYYLTGLSSSKEKTPRSIISTKNVIPEHYISYNINNLVRFTDHRAGVYMIGGIKKMAGTDAFLALSDDVKGCQKEEEKRCKKERFLKELEKQCGCVPWIFGPTLPGSQVRNPLFFARLSSEKFSRYLYFHLLRSTRTTAVQT